MMNHDDDQWRVYKSEWTYLYCTKAWHISLWLMILNVYYEYSIEAKNMYPMSVIRVIYIKVTRGKENLFVL